MVIPIAIGALASFMFTSENIHIAIIAIFGTYILVGVITYIVNVDEDSINYGIILGFLGIACFTVIMFNFQENFNKLREYKNAQIAENISVNEAGSITKASYIKFSKGILVNQYSGKSSSTEIEYDTEDKRIFEYKTDATAIPLIETEQEIKNEIYVWLICTEKNCSNFVTFSGVGKVEDFVSELPAEDVYAKAIKNACDTHGLVSAKTAILITNKPKDFHPVSERKKAIKSLNSFWIKIFLLWFVIGIYPVYVKFGKLVLGKIRK